MRQVLLVSAILVLATAKSQISIQPITQAPTTPSMCMVTVDESSNYNEIYWDEKLYQDAKTVQIYRKAENGEYEKVGELSTAVNGIFVDKEIVNDLGNPNKAAHTYKLYTIDANGNQSKESHSHSSMYIHGDQKGEFTWTAYIDGSGALKDPGYKLYRKDKSGKVEFILETKNTSAKDPKFSTVQGKDYVWFVVVEAFSCEDGGKTGTKSNNSNE